MLFFKKERKKCKKSILNFIHQKKIKFERHFSLFTLYHFYSGLFEWEFWKFVFFYLFSVFFYRFNIFHLVMFCIRSICQIFLFYLSCLMHFHWHSKFYLFLLISFSSFFLYSILIIIFPNIIWHRANAITKKKKINDQETLK